MAKRMVDKLGIGKVVVRVYWDYEWQEFQCTLSVDGKRFPDATYHTNDKDDAISTAGAMMLDAYKRIELARKVANSSVVIG